VTRVVLLANCVAFTLISAWMFQQDWVNLAILAVFFAVVDGIGAVWQEDWQL